MVKALIIQGGGTRASFLAGVTDELLKMGITFDEVYGTSAGALLGLNFVSNQIGRSRYLEVDMMNDLNFFSRKNLMKTGNVFDFDYLFNEGARGKFPFDFETFYKSPTKMYAVATSLKTGKPVYIEKSDPNFFDGVKASASLPLIMKPTAYQDDLLLDGGVVMPIPFVESFKRRVDKLVVLCTRPRGYRKKKRSSEEIIMKKFYKDYPAFLEAYLNSVPNYNDQMAFLDKLHDFGGAFVFYPSKPLKIGRQETNPDKLNKIIEIGIQDFKKIKEDLQRYLDK